MQVLAHAAGALGKDAIATVDPVRFQDVCSPKLGIGKVLTALGLSSLPLREMCFFSSTAAAWSQPEACHYAAANTALDDLASSCR